MLKGLWLDPILPRPHCREGATCVRLSCMCSSPALFASPMLQKTARASAIFHTRRQLRVRPDTRPVFPSGAVMCCGDRPSAIRKPAAIASVSRSRVSAIAATLPRYGTDLLRRCQQPSPAILDGRVDREGETPQAGSLPLHSSPGNVVKRTGSSALSIAQVKAQANSSWAREEDRSRWAAAWVSSTLAFFWSASTASAPAGKRSGGSA